MTGTGPAPVLPLPYTEVPPCMTEPAPRATLGRGERLTSAGAISVLARTGRGVTVPPFRLVGLWTPLPPGTRVRIAFAVPKRFLKRAHDRNRTRRLMREAYRLHKGPWLQALEAADRQCSWLLIYQRSEPIDHDRAMEGITRVFSRWMEKNLPA